MVLMRFWQGGRGGGSRGRVCVAVLCALLVFPAAAAAQQKQQATVTPAPAATPRPGPQDEYDRGVPRSSMRGYIEACRDGDYKRAAEYLDLRRLPKAVRARRGPKLALELKIVLDQELWIDWTKISNDADGYRNDGLPADQDRIGTIKTEKGSVDIIMERVPRADGVEIWKISAPTVAAIPGLYEQFGYGPLGEILPSLFFEFQFLNLQLWQWIGLFALVIIAAALSWVVAFLLVRAVRPWLSKREQVSEQVARLASGPLRLIVGVLLFRAGVVPLALPLPVRTVIGAVAGALLIIGITWLFMRIVDVIAQVVEQHLVSSGNAGVAAMLPLGRRAVKVILAGLALLAILQNIGFNVTSILAGLGIGGLAVALAAQKTLENLFAGVSVITDQPVRVGDFCRWGDRVGTIEDIGLRSTRIRTLDRTVVSIPNGEFAAMQIENFAKRDKIWLHPTIGLRYETTAEQLRYVLVEIKKMLLAHPRVDPEPARVRFAGFGDFSLNLEFFAYVTTTDYGEYLSIQEDIFLRIMDIVEESGTGFAFPSQTVYVGKDEGLDEEKSRAAEAQVARWRRENSLYLPDYPSSEAVKLERLDYPPQGSPGAKKS
jgi:MscS family membrane protein